MKYRINDPSIQSWVDVAKTSDFPIQNLPFGMVQKQNGTSIAASIIGDSVIDLNWLHEHNYFNGIALPEGIFKTQYLNTFIELGKPVTSAVRERLSDILNKEINYKDASTDAEKFLFPVAGIKNTMPVQVGDYTDFYSSKEHATNVGTMFRDPDNALLPNWLHLPVGYHGRASSIVISGTDIHRPKGQVLPNDSNTPIYGPSKLLDFELEMAFIIGKPNKLGQPIPIEAAEEHIFGMVLFNDWSARDIQKWEYVPLGPFGAKNFASTISPWIVTMEALEPFRTKGPVQNPEVLPYLSTSSANNYDINLFVEIELPNGQVQQVCQSNYKYMYWSMVQQLAHHTVTGCNMKIGDMCASGTISGPEKGSFGSMLEIAWKGTQPIDMPDGTQRKFILDDDTIHLKGYGEHEGIRIGFGPCSGKILPSN